MDSDNVLIPEENIYPSSLGPGVTNEDLRLNGPSAWSPMPNDTEPFVTIDLDKPSDVTGVILQGGGPDTDEYVTLFTVEYSPDGENFFPVTYNDQPVVRFWSFMITFFLVCLLRRVLLPPGLLCIIFLWLAFSLICYW